MLRPIWAEKQESANFHFVVENMRTVGGSYAQGFEVGWSGFGGWRGPKTYFQENNF